MNSLTYFFDLKSVKRKSKISTLVELLSRRGYPTHRINLDDHSDLREKLRIEQTPCVIVNNDQQEEVTRYYKKTTYQDLLFSLKYSIINDTIDNKDF